MRPFCTSFCELTRTAKRWQQLIDVADSGRFVDSNFEVRADRPLPATSPVEAANEAEDECAAAALSRISPLTLV